MPREGESRRRFIVSFVLEARPGDVKLFFHGKPPSPEWLEGMVAGAGSVLTMHGCNVTEVVLLDAPARDRP